MIVDDFWLTITGKTGYVIEERIKLKLQPKPNWLPSWLYWKIIKRLIVIEHST